MNVLPTLYGCLSRAPRETSFRILYVYGFGLGRLALPLRAGKVRRGATFLRGKVESIAEREFSRSAHARP
jgi:hypothetical protein